MEIKQKYINNKDKTEITEIEHRKTEEINKTKLVLQKMSI